VLRTAATDVVEHALQPWRNAPEQNISGKGLKSASAVFSRNCPKIAQQSADPALLNQCQQRILA
jgi:hypothetical protein